MDILVFSEIMILIKDNKNDKITEKMISSKTGLWNFFKYPNCKDE